MGSPEGSRSHRRGALHPPFRHSGPPRPWAAAVGATLLCCGAEAATLCRGPYLQSATPDSLVLVWRTEGPSRPQVRFGTAPQRLDRRADPEQILVRTTTVAGRPPQPGDLYRQPVDEAAAREEGDPDPSTPENVFQFEARLSGLQPRTTYYYAVDDGDRLLAGGDADHVFTTPPAAGTPADLRLWVVGDSGTGERPQAEVFAGMQSYVGRTGRRLDMYLHVGDMAYGDGTDAEFQRNFFDVYQPTLRQTVCWPTMGNHEGHTSRGLTGIGPYYDAYVLPTAGEAGGVASGCEAYYAFDAANVHFVCLDSHDLDRSPAGAMAQWLAADLEHAQGDWLIAFWHHPPYSKGSHDSDREEQLIEMRENLMPLLEAYGVDLVLAGHSHIYERSMLIDGAYATPTVVDGVVLDDGDGRPDGDGSYRKSAGRRPHQGTVAVVSGHGGASLGRKGTLPLMREILLDYGSLILDVRGDVLEGTMIDRAGQERDRFQIVKRGVTEPRVVARPRLPADDPAQITEIAIDWQEEPLGEAPAGWTAENAASWRIEETPADDPRPQRPEGRPGVSPPPRAVRCALAAAAADAPLRAVYDEFVGPLSELEGWLQFPADAPAATAGFLLGYRDPRNYYLYALNRGDATAEFWEMRDGELRQLARRGLELDFGRPIKVELEPAARLIEVQLQDDLEYTLPLDQPFPDGRVGVWVGAGGAARFAHLSVERKQP